jgi:branched-chain amino acid transport system substrate-binding protein
MIAWSSGKLLEAAIAHLAPAEQAGPLTAALVVEGLGRIHDEDLAGLTARLSFTPGSRSVSSGCVFFERLGPTGWTAPNGSRPVC